MNYTNEGIENITKIKSNNTQILGLNLIRGELMYHFNDKEDTNLS